MAKVSRTSIERLKAETKLELDDIERKYGKKARLAHAMQKVAALAEDPEDLSQLHRFIYIMSSLVHHQRSGGLNWQQIRKAADLGKSILVSLGIEPGKSKLVSLHSELNLVLSQIFRKQGKHWLAAWEQHLADVNGRGSPTKNIGFNHLAAANRVLRLGQAKRATEFFHQAIEAGLDKRNEDIARLGIAKATRLSGDLETARALNDTIRQQPELDSNVVKESIWESMLIELSKTHDLMPLYNATRKGASHCEATFIIEVNLLARALPTMAFIQKLPSTKSMARRSDLDPTALGVTYHCGVVVDGLYRNSVPLPHRFATLGELLESAEEMLTIELEMLVWIVAARFFLRSKASDLAVLTLGRYRTLSFSLSNGSNGDVLGLWP